MEREDRSPGIVSFAEFRLDVGGLELRKGGLRVRLRRQPTQVLALLAQRAGQIVTRGEIQREIWGTETFVDFERGLNNCIKQIRQALNDDPNHPKYVETIPRQGYRFLARVELSPKNGDDHAAGWAQPEAVTAAATPANASRVHRLSRIWIAVAASLVAISAVAGWVLIGRTAYSFHERDGVLVADFDNHTGDPRFDDALLTAFVVSLEQSRYANIVPRSRIYSALQRMGKAETARVTAETGREICQREGFRGLITVDITRTGQQFALTAELIDPVGGASVRSYSERAYGEDHVLDALDRIAAHIRADLGESLYQIHRASQPLPQVTTASLTALKDYADGLSLWRKHKFGEALGQYQAAVAIDPNFAMAHAALGTAYCSHVFDYQRERCDQEYKRALSLSSRITERERRLIELSAAEGLGHIEDCYRLFPLYLSEYPDDWRVRYDYGRVLRMHGREREAVAQYKELLRIDPNDAGTYVQIATAYKKLNQYPEAIQAYSGAFRINPAIAKISNINREYGFTLVANGEERQAEQAFSALCQDADTRGSCLHSLGLLALMYGQYAKAQKDFAEALSIAEQQHDPFLVARNHFMLAVIYSGEGKKPGQRKELDAALSDFKALGPKVEYGSLVGQEFARAGDVARAEQIEKLIAPLADPNSDEQSGYVRLLQGEIALAKGNPVAAAHLFALQDPRYGSSVETISQEAIGRAYERAGKIDSEVSAYEAFFAGNSCPMMGWEPQQRCEDAHVALATAYLARGEKAKAAGTLAPLLKNWKFADANLVKNQALKIESHISN